MRAFGMESDFSGDFWLDVPSRHEAGRASFIGRSLHERAEHLQGDRSAVSGWTQGGVG